MLRKYMICICIVIVSLGALRQEDTSDTVARCMGVLLRQLAPEPARALPTEMKTFFSLAEKPAPSTIKKAPEARGLPQTKAYLSVPELHKKLYSYYLYPLYDGIWDVYSPVVDQIMSQEQEPFTGLPHNKRICPRRALRGASPYSGTGGDTSIMPRIEINGKSDLNFG